MTIFDFFKIRLLSFCTAELKSEDIFVLRRVSGYSFCWLNPQPLPIVLSKHFNHPHPYIEIATAISDMSQCSGGMQEWVIQITSIPILVSVLFPSLHLKYFRVTKIFVTSLYCFYAHAHETTPTSVYKLSHTHIVVGPEVLAVFALVCTFPEVLNSC